MPDGRKISELNEETNVTDAHFFPVSDGNETKKVSFGTLNDAWADALDYDEINARIDTDVEREVNAWLAAHPEATTTVQDDSVDTDKIADGAVTDDKLAKTGGVLTRVSDIDGRVNVPLELGNISYNQDPWRFVDSTTRARTPQGSEFTLMPGSILYVTDATKYEFCAAWLIDGASSYWKQTTLGWVTEYIAPVQGEYSVLIRKKQESAITVDEAQSAIVVINAADESLVGAADALSNVNLFDADRSIRGYISGSGDYVADYANGVRVSDYIPVTEGEEFCITARATVTIVTGDTGMWAACAFYDENKSMVGSRTAWTGTAVYADTVIQKVVTAPTGAKFMRVSARTYEDGYIRVVRGKESPAATRFGFVQDMDPFDTGNGAVVAFNVKSTNHRGYALAPENTLPAYRLSKKVGFEQVECDVSMTSDRVPVLLHDSTINRTARNADGSAISGTVSIGGITYQQALQYDFGIWKGAAYAGTKIPTFEQFILLCRNIGLHPYIELKTDGGYTETEIRSLVDTVKTCGMRGKVTWISFSDQLLQYVKSHDASARLGYVVGDITSAVIATAQGLKTSTNEVFINASSYTSAMVQLCSEADLPLEVWTVNNPVTLAAIPAYVTGIASDILIAGKVLYQANA